MNPQSVFERMFGDIGSAEERAARFKSQGQHSRFGDRGGEPLEQRARAAGPLDRRRVFGEYSRGREPNPILRSSSGCGGRHSRCAGRHTRHLRGACACHVRPHRARMESRRHARGHVHEGRRSEQHRLPADRRARVASHRLASWERSRDHRASTRKINAYHLSLFGDFVEKLRATPDGDGSLLDHSLVMYGSGMGNGDKHDQSTIPIMLAGSAAGRLKGGRHIANPDPTPLANLIAGLGRSRGARSRQDSRTPPGWWSS